MSDRILHSRGRDKCLRENLDIEESKILITVPGTVCERKGQIVFLHALEELMRRGKIEGIAVLFVGDITDTEYGTRFMKLINSEGYKSCVQFLGFRKDIFEIISASDIVSVPSLADPFPWVILESMALGKPVVASDVGGIAELVVHGETGLLVEPDNASALAGALLALIEDPNCRSSMGEHGAKRISRYFSEKNYIAAFERLYQSTFDN